MDRRYVLPEQSPLARYPPNMTTSQASSPLLLPHPAVLQQQSSAHQPHLQQPSQTHQQSQNPHLPFHSAQIQHQTNLPLANPFQHHPSNSHINPSRHPHQLQQHQRIPQQLHLQPRDSNDHDHHTNMPATINSAHRSDPQLINRQQNQRQHQQTSPYQLHQMHVSSMPNSLAIQSQQQSRPSVPQQQNQFSTLPFSHNQHQVTSLGFASKSNGASFTMANSIPQNQQNHMVPTIARDSQQPQSQLPIQNTQNVNQGPDPGNSNNAPFGHPPPLQVQTNIPNQQPSQASFATLANLPNAMLQSGIVDETTGTSQHFGNTQSGEGLSTAYPWDPTQHQVGVGAQGLGMSQTQHSILPLVGDTRATGSPRNTTHTTTIGHPMRNGSTSFTGTFNSGMGVLAPSMNTSTVVSGLGTAPAPANMPQSLSPTGTDISPRNSLCAGEGGGRFPKVNKKGRATVTRKPIPNRNRATRTINTGRAPITSPVSTATLPAMKQTPVINGNTVTSTPSTNSRPSQRGKARNRIRSRETETQEAATEGPIGSNSSSAANIVPPHLEQAPNTTITTNNPGAGAPQFSAIKTAEVSTVWGGRRPIPSRSKAKRKLSEGISVTVPVHMRNPKRGRARVFRECKECKKENHIRRSICSECQAPLPAGKRRRDGNTIYGKKTPGEQVTNPCIVTQSTSGNRSGSKDEIVEASVATTSNTKV